MNIVGIDPGLSGAVAYLLEDNILFWDTPTLTIKSGKKIKREYNIPAMVEILKDCLLTQYVALEKIHSMPGQGVRSMFSIGEGYGLWKGIIVTLGDPLILVTPQSWKKVMMQGMGKEKDASVLRASELFPQIADQLVTPRGRKLDGRADALLIAKYAKDHRC